MRVLSIPAYTNSSIEGCSAYHSKKCMFSTLADQPNTWVYLPILRGQKPLPEFMRSNITLIEIDYISEQMKNLITPDKVYTDLFNGISGKYVVDAVICDKVPASLPLRRVFSTYAHYTYKPVWVNINEFNLDQKRYGVLHNDYRIMQAMGMCNAWNCYASETNKRDLERAAKRWLSPTAFQSIKTIGFFKRHLMCDKLDKILKEYRTQEAQVKTLHYAQAFNAVYNVDVIIDDFDYIYKSGRPVNVLVTTPSSGGGAIKQDDYKYVDWNFSCPQETFFKKACKAHVFLVELKMDEINTGILEQMYLGQIGVLRSSGASKSMTIPDYPFLYESRAEARVMLREALDNYDNYSELILKQRAFIRDKFDGKASAIGLYNKIREIRETDEYNFNHQGSLIKEIKKWTEDKDLFTWEELSNFLKTETVCGYDLLGEMKGRSNYLSKGDIRNMVLQSGFYDNCKDELPIFERRVK